MSVFALFFCLFVFLSLSLSLRPHHWEKEERKHVLQSDHLLWKACCVAHLSSMSPFWLSSVKTFVFRVP